jgi:hypothetical protein
MRSSGLGKLPVCVVRIRSVARFMASSAAELTRRGLLPTIIYYIL